MLKSVVDFSLNQLELPLFLLDQRFLMPQFFFNHRNFPVLHIFFDFRKRQIENPQITNRVEYLKLTRTVITVACLRIGIFGDEKALFFIMAQCAEAQMEHAGNFADFKKLFVRHRLTLLSVSDAGTRKGRSQPRSASRTPLQCPSGTVCPGTRVRSGKRLEFARAR